MLEEPPEISFQVTKMLCGECSQSWCLAAGTDDNGERFLNSHQGHPLIFDAFVTFPAEMRGKPIQVRYQMGKLIVTPPLS